MDPKRVQKSIIFYVIFWLDFERPNLTPEAQFLRDVSGEMQIFKTPIFGFWEKKGPQNRPENEVRKTLKNALEKWLNFWATFASRGVSDLVQLGWDGKRVVASWSFLRATFPSVRWRFETKCHACSEASCFDQQVHQRRPQILVNLHESNLRGGGRPTTMWDMSTNQIQSGPAWSDLD